MKKLLSKSVAKTKKIGQELAQRLKGGEVIALVGQLGSGKTTFAQGVARGLGIKKMITSPSFVLMNQYQVPGRKIRLCHFDFYRLKKSNDPSPAGLTDYLGKKEYILIIEWADRIERLLPKEIIKINFKYLDEEKREIDISN